MEELPDQPKTSKGEQRRALILATALELFQERGYDETTMRAIAERAGVALGSAYYYFRSKEQLIQAFYGQTHDLHLVASEPILKRERTFKARLLGVMQAKLETIEPFHRFSGVLFKTAADPESPLNPFSEESTEVRDESITLFREVVEGSSTRMPYELREKLPLLLWTYHMGIILFWINDRSSEQVRTRRLMERTVELIERLVLLGSMTIARPLLRSVLKLIEEIEDVA